MRHLALLLIAFTPTAAWGWGDTGHRITGSIAEQMLSGKARAHVRVILAPGETLAQAATWPDFMRSNPAPYWQSTANPWHYVTVPTGQPYRLEQAPPEGDAASALRRFTETLRSPTASLEEKQLALRFVTHIIGDLHQPLHNGRPGDRGGNDVQVTFFGANTNLHSLWDTGIIDSRKLAYSEWAQWLMADLTPEETIAWWSSDPNVWIGESVTLREQIYPTDTSLSWDYVYQNLPHIERRLQQAGVRIAAYLNLTFE